MSVRVIWRLVAMNVMQTLEYRGAFFVYMVNTVVVPVISLLVWLTVSEQGVRLPYDRRQLVTYYVLLSVVSMLTATWLAEYVAENIRLGGLSPWLLRPAPYITHDIANNIGEKVVKLPLLVPLVALVALIFHSDLRLSVDPRAWLLFALSLPMAAAVAFLLDFVIGSLAFWVQDVRGLIRVKGLVGALLNGQLAPLALFPHSFAGFLHAQPFRYTLSFPLEVLTGRLSTAELARGFAWQVFYCGALWACYRLVWRYGLRSYSATGA
jgi:ABC-2 type transport system permease protein